MSLLDNINKQREASKKQQSPQQPPIQGGLIQEVALGINIAGQMMTESQVKKG
jgi:hypothetical protein